MDKWQHFCIGGRDRLNMELDLQSLFGLHVQCTAVLIG
jgi:hypothetical protein